MRHTIILIAILAIGLLGGWFAQQVFDGEQVASGTDQAESSQDETALEHASKHLVPGYVCPMHPSVVSNAPGSCPICGMDLEPKQLKGGSDDSGIAVSPAMSNSLGVRIAHVDKGRVMEQVFASGNVERVTDKQTTMIAATLDGTLKEVYVAVGDWVSEGDFLLAIDAPHFASLQAAYIEVLKQRDYASSKPLRAELAKLNPRNAVLDGTDRANNMELTPEFLIEAPHSGTIKKLPINAGEPVKEQQMLLQISTPALARVRLRTHSRAARSVVPGRRAQLDIPHQPGLVWPGRVVNVLHGDSGFFSTIEADFEVPSNEIDQGIFVGAYVNAGTSDEVLRVPATAVIRVEGESRVVKLRADGQFQPVVVQTGYIGHKWAVIESGLSLGDAVVERAQFLIDSEASLRAGMARMADEQ